MLRWHTDSSLHGATRNPWDPARTPGGSSGGDAVAVATGMAPLGLGSDLGGSLRVPALANGVAALRPTPGRVPFAGAPEWPPSMTQQLFAVAGPIGRDVAALHAALAVLAGPDPADPWSLPVPLEDPAAPPERRRVAVTLDPGGDGVDPIAAGGGAAPPTRWRGPAGRSTRPNHPRCAPLPPVGFDLGGPDNIGRLWHSLRLVVAVNALGLPAVAWVSGMLMPAGTGSWQRARWSGGARQLIGQGRSLSGLPTTQMCLIRSPATANAITATVTPSF